MSPTQRQPVTRALISVWDKTGLAELIAALGDVEILSTGSTAEFIRGLGRVVTPVESVTGFTEAFDGRVKTLHPHVHGAVLADRENPAHVAELATLGIRPIDLVVVNLYPFAETLQSGGSPRQLVEKIDVGGPALLRAAAKNHGSVAVLCSPEAYADAIVAIRQGGFTREERARLAARAFAHVATYDLRIAMWMSAEFDQDDSGWPRFRGAAFGLSTPLRYGENPHQSAALYDDLLEDGLDQYSLARAIPIHGKAMSYNNYLDAEAAVRAVADFGQPCVAIIKHTNPCGIAVAESIDSAYVAALACDPISAFGGVVAANRQVTESMARQVADIFTEVLIAPSFAPEALEILRAKPSLRLLQIEPDLRERLETREVTGGVLVQEHDVVDGASISWALVAGKASSSAELADLEFAWRVIRSVKSNAIVLAKDAATVGVGMGQVNRVDAARLAVARAGSRAIGAVAASDAFFPFPDGVQVLADAGVSAIVQPGGSVRDDEVIAAAAAAGMTMYFTGVRRFTH